MSKAGLTRAFVVGVLILIAIYDLIALTAWGPSSTISQVVGLRGSFEAPTIPFGVGILMGHLFWPQKQKTTSADPS